MKPGIPWSVKGIEPEVREAAKYAARRSGLSLGEWLNGVILEQAETDDEDQDDHYEPPRRQPSRGERLGRVSERLGRMDQQNQHTAANRLMGSRERGPDPRLVSDVLERLAASERRTETAFETITERLEELAQQISAPRPGDAREDDAGLRAVESAIRNIVSHMEVNEKRTREQLVEMQGKISRAQDDGASEAAIRRLDQRIQELTRRLDRADSGEQAQELLGVMESHIARVNERIDLIRQPSVAEVSRTRADIALLKERMDTLQENSVNAGAVTVLKADLQTMGDGLQADLALLKERMDALRENSVDASAVTARKADLQTMGDGLQADLALLKERMDALQDNSIDAAAVTMLKTDLQTMGDALRADLARVSRRADQAAMETISVAAETELANQVADLHARLIVAEDQLVQVSVLERSITDIIGRLDETASGHGPSPELAALEAALNSVAESSRDADERTQATLQAVHETLEQIATKIAQMEAEPPQPEYEETALPLEAEPAEEMVDAVETVTEPPAAAWRNVLRAHVTGPAYTAPTAENNPPREIEEPLRTIRLDSEPVIAEQPQLARTEDYVAAARRAALAAQLAEEEAPKLRGSKKKLPKAAKPAPTRRRKLLMAALVLLMAVSAFTVAAPKLINRSLPQATEPASPATVPAPSLQSEPTNSNKSSMLAPQSGMAAGDSIADLVDKTASNATSSVAAKPAAPGFTDDFGPASLREAALKGDTAAQFVTATRYLEGKGTAPDAALAAKWYGEAASHGLAPAQYRLATLYELGRGLQRNLIAARDLYERAAAQGNVKAMHNLAVLLSSGEADAKPDYAKALSWFEQAARHGLPDSQFNLAVLYDRGAGTEADAVKAAFWYGVLAAKGDADAAAKARALAPRLTSSERKKVASDIAAFRAKPAKLAANQISVSDPTWQGEDATSSTKAAKAVAVTPAQVKEAQRLLTLLGYTAGRADGILSDKTANAVRIFQLQNGLPVNGMVDAALISVLREKTPG